MAQNRNPQPQDQSTPQGTPGSAGKTTEGRGRTDETGTDRERAIETRRDEASGREVGRRYGTTPVYGPGRTPFSMMRTMMDDMDRFFENIGFGRFGGRSNLSRDGSALEAVWAPQVETFRRGDRLVIRADLPGLRKEDVSVEVDNDTLTITGERRDEHEEDRDGYYRSERSYGRFYRALPLPADVNPDQVEATVQDGVLEVSIPAPKEEQPRRKRIQVR